MMKTVTVAGAKGGTAKTTTTLALAHELAACGLRVAIADCDPQASATLGLGQAPAADPLTAAPVQLEFDFGAASADAAADSQTGELWLFPGGRPLALASKLEVVQHLTRGVDACDVMVVDTVPTVGPITLGAVDAADLVIVPLQPAPYALAGLADLLQLVARSSSAPRARALLTIVDARRRMAGEIADRIGASRPGLLYQSRIPSDARCERAAAALKPVGAFDPRSRAARAYSELASEVRRDLGLAVAEPERSAPLARIAPLAIMAATSQLTLFGGLHV